MLSTNSYNSYQVEYYNQEIEDLVDSAMEEESGSLEREIEDLLRSIEGNVKKEIPNVSISEFTEFAVKMPIGGKIVPFSFNGREYLKPIYDTDARNILLKFSRQTEKSTALGNRSIAYSALIPGFSTLFVSATAQQAKVFSVDRVKNPLEMSPELRRLMSSKLNQNVFFKQFLNRSQIRMRYAFLNADRVRGITADLINIDEIQDIIAENIPIIEQCASHSYWKLFCYSGTPKSRDNTIQVYWDSYSTQNEWVVPCEKHGTPKNPSSWHWNILGNRNIGKTGLICTKCGGPISARHPMAQWVAMQPVTPENKNKVTFEGYRVPQIMVPWVEWDEILKAKEQYTTAQLNNEVLGLSYDSGDRPISRKELKGSCRPDIHFRDVEENAQRCHNGVFVGIDWGTGERKSYTLLTLGGYMDHGFQIFFMHRFIGEDLDPRLQLNKIAKLLNRVSFKIAGCDYGGGFYTNDWLARNFGILKILKFAYAGQPTKKVSWNKDLGRYIVHRTEVMSAIFNAIKQRKIWLPNFEEMLTPHGEDILNIFSEFNKRIRMIQYNTSPDKPDDTFHSILLCVLASMVIHPRPDILVPISEGDVSFNR